MQSIPSTLLEKLRLNFQTIGTNAQPRMDIIAQKTSKYITEGNALRPRTVRTGNSLTAIDICLRRENQNLDPTEIVMAYIENGFAKVATLPYVNTPDQEFEYQYTVGPADDVACDFDGRWARITDRTGIYYDTSVMWSLVTFGEPYIAIVNSGVLTVCQGQGSPVTLVASGVSKCVILRGWKSASDNLTDQGIICAYLKTDTKLYYRNYCEQEDGSYIWEVERELTDFTSPVSNLGIFRTNDYRIGFLAEMNNVISMMVTDRSWSGMAIPPENISVDSIAISVVVTQIEYHEGFHAEYISAETLFDISVKWGLPPVIVAMENINDGNANYGLKVKITFDQLIFGATGNELAFLLTDEEETSWASTGIEQTGPKELTVTFADFNNAVGNVVVTYTPGTLIGEVEYVAAGFFGFTPIGLVPTALPAPLPITLSNPDTLNLVVEFDRVIAVLGSASGFTVTYEEPAWYPGGSNVLKTYTPSAIDWLEGEISSHTVALGSGTLSDMEVL